MSAWIVVVDTPYFGKTDASGRVQIDVPDGEHLVRAWQPVSELSTPVEHAGRAGTPLTLRLAASPP